MYTRDCAKNPARNSVSQYVPLRNRGNVMAGFVPQPLVSRGLYREGVVNSQESLMAAMQRSISLAIAAIILSSSGAIAQDYAACTPPAS